LARNYTCRLFSLNQQKYSLHQFAPIFDTSLCYAGSVLTTFL